MALGCFNCGTFIGTSAARAALKSTLHHNASGPFCQYRFDPSTLSTPEGMVPDPGLDTGAKRPPLDHAIGVLLPHRLAGEAWQIGEARKLARARKQ